MKNILLSLAIIIASSLVLVRNASAQCYQGINPEHMPESIKIYNDSSTNFNARKVSEPVKNSCPGFDNLHLSAFSDKYSPGDNVHYSVFYVIEKASAQVEDINDYSASTAAEFLLMTLGSRPPGWYITRMTVVQK